MDNLAENPSLVAAEDLCKRSTERIKIIDKLDSEMEYKSDRMAYYATDNFIVVYRDIPGIYKKFGSWIDTHPQSLAEFLEQKLLQAETHFQLPSPTTFQVLEVSEGRGLTGLIWGGYHSGSQRGLLGQTEWNEARFNTIYSKRRSAVSGPPNLYETSVHEAIGHGFATRNLLLQPGEVRKEIRPDFLEEGLATYTENLLMGVSAHDEIVFELIQHAELKFTSWSGDWLLSDPGDERVGERLTKTSITDLLNVNNIFKLLNKAGKLQHKDANTREAYYRGSSLVKYFIDKFGMEKFKQWAGQATAGNFIESLCHTTGLSPATIEKGWKEAVLSSDLDSNQFLLKHDKSMKEAERLEWRDKRKKILEAYKQLV